jgi:hypothetical protein
MKIITIRILYSSIGGSLIASGVVNKNPIISALLMLLGVLIVYEARYNEILSQKLFYPEWIKEL